MRYLWVLLVLLVTLLSLTPAPYLARYVNLSLNDKLLHFSAYAALAFLPVAGFRTTPHKIQALVFTLTLGYLLELAQPHVPGRTYDPWDMVANSAGIATGAVCGLLLRILFRQLARP